MGEVDLIQRGKMFPSQFFSLKNEGLFYTYNIVQCKYPKEVKKPRNMGERHLISFDLVSETVLRFLFMDALRIFC